MRGDIGIVVL